MSFPHVAREAQNTGELPSVARAMLAELGAPRFEAREITSLDTRRDQRSTFVLRSPEGQTYKLRRISSVGKAEWNQAVRSHLDPSAFSGVVARRENYLLEEWVEGVPLGRLSPNRQLLRRCGLMLANIHRTILPETCRGGGGGPAPEHFDRLEEGLEYLQKCGVLSVKERDRLWRRAARFRPAVAEVGFVHRDFCAENLVLRDGRPCSVDNAGCSRGYLDEDIARTWYRWPMDRSSWFRFLAAYGRRRSPRGFLEHAPYWVTLVLVRSTRFRLLRSPSQFEVPYCRLLSLLEKDFTG